MWIIVLAANNILNLLPRINFTAPRGPVCKKILSGSIFKQIPTVNAIS